MSNSNEDTIVDKHCTSSPFSQQATADPTTSYKNKFLLLPDNANSTRHHHRHNTHISHDIRNSYIQQNLPVRRQSLIVYHDKMRSEQKLSKSVRELNTLPSRRRHISIAPTAATSDRRMKKDTSSGAATGETGHIDIAQAPGEQKLLCPKVPLTIHIVPPKSIEFLTEPNDTIIRSYHTVTKTQKQQQQQQHSPPTTLFDMSITEEERNNAESDLLKQQPNIKLEAQPTRKPTILNEVTDNIQYEREEKDQQHIWTGLPSPPPFSKLRNVFSRLQPSSGSNSYSISDNESNTDSSLLLSTKRSDQLENNETYRKHKKAYSSPSIIMPKRRRNTKSGHPTTAAYRALLSHIATELSKKIEISTIDSKDRVQFFHDVFTGTEAVDCILDIIDTENRMLALIVGRALESQGFFHHVTYDCKLTDDSSELYQFQYIEQDEAPSHVYRLPIPSQFIPSSLTTAALSTNDNATSSKKTKKKSASSICKTIAINGVFTILTACYSPTCSTKMPCYSYTCPRKVAKTTKHNQILSNAPLIETVDGEKEKNKTLWRQSVPKSILKGTNSMEQKRQECIFELIYTERDFCRDLQYVQNFWIKPLLYSDIIPAERRKSFIRDVFWNWDDIVKISSALSKDLTVRQENYPVIPCVSDIMMKHVKGFEPFLTYGAHQTIGKHCYEIEKKRNARFAQFVEKLQRRPESRRLELHGYLTKPTSRLGRYNLLLNAIYNSTPNNHQDHRELPKVMTKITDFLVQLNKKVGLTDNAFYLEQITSKIIPTKKYDLCLTEPNRQLLLQGIMKRANQQHTKNNSTTVHASIIDNSSSIDIQLFLFDHMLIFCKIKKQDGMDCYKLFRKPISLKSLSVFIPNTIFIPSTRSHIYNRLTPSTTSHSSTASDISNTTARLNKYPISFKDTDDSYGMSHPPITLIAPSEYMRKVWIEKIHEQQQKIASTETVEGKNRHGKNSTAE